MPKYHIWTIGCQMNKAESERLAGRFEELGYEPALNIAEADVVILNSCVVRQSAENRVINKLQALRAFKRENPGAVLALTGCLVDKDIAGLASRFPHVDHFFPAGAWPDWVEGGAGLPRRPAPAVYVPIMQGCNNFCTYCIVPYRRGRERSRPPGEITAEVTELVSRGAREVTLLGQNVDSYGKDLPDKPDLAELLGKLDIIDGLARIRFLTNHPKDMSDNLINAIAGLSRVCEQISLPVQAGSDEVLKAMGRGYTAGDYRELVRRIRLAVPDVALSTDIIVGFPGETTEQFRQTVNLLLEIKFDTVHVAAYSPRSGTVAAREMADDVPPEEKKERLAEIERLQEETVTGINARLLGQTVEILVEGRARDKWYGRTRSDKLVFFRSRADCAGRLMKIKIEKTGPWSLQGYPETNTGQEEHEQVI